MLIALFAVVCGLAGEAIEVWRLRAAGLAMPSVELRITLFALYAAAGGGAAWIAALAAARRWRVAAALFAMAVVVPWANFEYLPAAGSLRSVLGSLAIAGLAATLGWTLALLPRTALALVAVAALTANLPVPERRGTLPADTTTAGGRPNLILVLVDTLRADHLGVYGYERPTSPRIDDLAREGVRFERAIAQAPWTKPSVASLFTGRFTHHHGVVRSLDALGPELPTLAEVLSAAGYRTAAFSANPWITPEFRFDRGFGEFESGRAMGPQLTNAYRTVRRSEAALRRIGLTMPLSKWLFRWSGRDNISNTERDETQAREVIAWLSAAAEDERPFFLYVHMIGPHDPYDPPVEFAAAFARSNDEPQRLTPARVETAFERAQPLPEDKLLRLVDQYDAAIAHADFLVGTMLDEVERRGLAGSTVVVLTSDHGEEFYEHGNWRHGNQLYDEVVRVPLLIRDPRGPRGVVRSDPAMLVDLMPTILSLLEVPEASRPAELDGWPLLPAPPAGARDGFTEHWWLEGGTYVARAIERQGLKLISAHDEGRGRHGEALYDLHRDAGEQVDLLVGGEVAEADLAGLRRAIGELSGERPGESVASLEEIDAATRERLRRLGYLDEGADR